LGERDYSGTPLTTKLGAAFDDDWSAVRLVYRREDRP
jgi:hypothetical protein